MTSISEPRGIFLMPLSIISFTVNTLAVRAIATGIGAALFFDATFGLIELCGAAFTMIATLMIDPRTSKTNPKKLSPQKTK
ncbi:MAG: hypothetical protein ACJAVK_002991 [Akkermansiaceae bacterium]|jgi:hypothetical protein